MPKLTVSIDRFPIAGKFTIARGSRTEAVVVTATIEEPSASGHGECVPYARYGETVEGVAAATAKAAERPILKVKFGAPDGDIERIRAVRRAAPQATLIADANEGWTEANIEAHLAACAEEGYALVEQPLPAKADAYLGQISRPVPILADESVHDRASLDRLVGLYEVVNIKLDKTGGLTEALALADAAEAKGFSLMIGCMVGTSLAMAPALMLAPRARFVDLDGPLLLARDREPGLRYEGSIVYPPEPALWG